MKLPFVVLAASLSAATATPLNIEKRQSTTWQYNCRNSAAPTNFNAFNLAGCAAQLSFDKDRYIGVQWEFEATYADGSKAQYTPFRNFNNFGTSDTFYPNLGNNFVTRSPGSTAFTAVHEFTNVCRSGQAPVSWRFFTTSTNTACTAASYRYTTGQIRTVGGVSRPPTVSGVSIRRVNDAGDFQVSWSTNSRAAAYSVIMEYPTGSDEVGNPYTNTRGARVQGTTATIPTLARRQDVARKAIVHAVDSQGVWSLTNDVPAVSARW